MFFLSPYPLDDDNLYFHRLKCHPFFCFQHSGVLVLTVQLFRCYLYLFVSHLTMSKKELWSLYSTFLKPYPTLLGLHHSVSLPSNWLPELEALLEFSPSSLLTHNPNYTQSSFTSCTFPKIYLKSMILCLSVTTLL